MNSKEPIYQPLSVCSSIQTTLKRTVLLKGTCLGTCGMALLISSVIFLPATKLDTYGWILFIVAMGLITYGLLPYRRLCRLETDPDELCLSLDNTLHYLKRGKVVLVIPKSKIQSSIFLDKKIGYGILFLLKDGQELFFPYFTKRAYDALQLNS